MPCSSHRGALERLLCFIGCGERTGTWREFVGEFTGTGGNGRKFGGTGGTGVCREQIAFCRKYSRFLRQNYRLRELGGSLAEMI